MMRVELILEGGGMRGVYSAGVLDFFMDKHIIFKDITAVSAGVCVATSYLSNQRGRSYQTISQYCNDKRYFGVSSFVKTGSAFGIDFIFRTIPDELLPFNYEAYKQSGINLTAVCTNLRTGKAHYELLDDIKAKLEYAIASCSLPIVSKTVRIDGLKLLDGGVIDPIPIQHSVDLGFDYHVLVLTRNHDYRKCKSLSTRIVASKYIRYKDFAANLVNRHITYNNSLDLIEKLEAQGKALVIRPSSAVAIDRFERNPDKLKCLYELGYNDAQSKYEQILEMSKKCLNFTIKENENV